MECPHLEDCVKITSLPEHSHGTCKWECAVCSTEQSPWLCLRCGVVNCGRYVSGHAKHHSDNESEHLVCMDCHTCAAYCYGCDEFVVNDTLTNQMESVRQKLQQLSANNDTDSTDCEYVPHNGLDHSPPHTSSSHKHGTHLHNCAHIQDKSTSNNHSPRHSPLKLSPHSSPTKHLSHEHSNKRTADQDYLKENYILHGRRSRHISKNEQGDENAHCSKKLKKDENKPKSSGLRNLGNTCFMNAVLQSLSNIQSFSGYIKQLPSMEPTQQQKKKIQHTRSTSIKELDNYVLVEELRKTLISLWQGNKAAISPESLFSVVWKVVPRFRGYQQQDAHEFMRYLLDRLHTELLTLLPYPNRDSPYIGAKDKSTIVTAIFGGILQSEVTCLICGTNSKKHDPFLDLSLDIPTHFTSKTPKPKDGQATCHLSDCLSSFTDVEELEDTELYMCGTCKLKQRSTKRFWIRRLPNVLCLHLKRFRWSTYFRVKVDTYVDFPLQGLDMSKYLLNNIHETRNSFSGSNQYDLAAVVVHHGNGAGSGHYTSYASHEGHWYHFNDSTVSACDEQTVRRCKAYILFYVRKQLKLPDYMTVRS